MHMRMLPRWAAAVPVSMGIQRPPFPRRNHRRGAWRLHLALWYATLEDFPPMLLTNNGGCEMAGLIWIDDR